VTWTPEARRTLEEVIDHIARDSAQGARAVLEQALSAAASLETLATRGRVVPE
jgi:plasmid stabilization system protein ParE